MPARVLVVGLDAADPQVVRELAADGRMPTVAGLLADGTALDVHNPDGFYVGATWPTLLTGRSAGHHGRWWPNRVEVGSYGVLPSRIEVEPFWDALARAGRRVAIIDVPFAAVDPNLDVTHVAEWTTHDRVLGFRASSTALADAARAKLGEPIDDCDRYSIEGRREDLEPVLINGIEAKTDLASRLLERSDWDLFTVVFGESHCAGHQLWHLHDPDHPDHDEAVAGTVGDPLARVYEALDGALATLLAGASRDTTVLVLLSHGMGPHYEGSTTVREVLRRLETAWRLRAPSTGRARHRARQLALRPARWLGLMPKRMWLLDGSRAFCQAPNASICTGVRINVLGRDPHGVIAPGNEYEEVCRALASEFCALTDGETGRRVVRRVLQPRELYSGDHVEAMPDLLVEWSPERPIQSVTSATIGRVHGAYRGHRTGDHRRDGLLLVSPGREHGSGPTEIDSLGIPAGVSRLLDVPNPDLEGNALTLVPGTSVRPPATSRRNTRSPAAPAEADELT